MAALFASLPLTSRLLLGVWGFEAAGGVAALCAAFGAYCRVLSRRAFATLPDPASELEEALELAHGGHTEEAAELLGEILELSPWLWQAYQYRAELHLLRPESYAEAVEDLTAAIRLAPAEPHLYALRAHAYGLLGDGDAAARDYETARSPQSVTGTQ
jgi:tetratricopeptide (TPR) repeat protein